MEIEEWNEYGELKQHVTIVKDPNATPIKSAMPTPLSTPSNPPVVLQENKKPETTTIPQTPKTVEPAKVPVVNAPNPMTLALRQVGEEAAQKAKDNKKKGLETVSKAEPANGKVESPNIKAISKPETIDLLNSKKESPLGGFSSLQSPNSTAWRTIPSMLTIPMHSAQTVEERSPLQSPTSASWRPEDINPPILEHRGSEVSRASPEEIKKIEDEATIKEEDEEDSDSSEESSSEEEEDVKKPSPVVAKQAAAKPQEESSSESEDSDEEEDDEEEVKKPSPAVAKVAARPKPKEESSSEDDESSSEEDDDDDEEEAAKPPGKMVVKSKEPAKVVEEEDTSEESASSDDEVPPKGVKA